MENHINMNQLKMHHINNQQHCEGKRLGKTSKMMILQKCKKVGKRLIDSVNPEDP
jgi:hypothetical protein